MTCKSLKVSTAIYGNECGTQRAFGWEAKIQAKHDWTLSWSKNDAPRIVYSTVGHNRPDPSRLAWTNLVDRRKLFVIHRICFDKIDTKIHCNADRIH